MVDLGEVEDMQDDLADLFEDMTEINDIMGKLCNEWMMTMMIIITDYDSSAY